MLHGKGAGNYDPNSQSWLTNDYEEKRRIGLEDRTKLTTTEIGYYEISGTEGTGLTNSKTYEVKQNPFPDSGKETIDIRTLPQIQ